MYSSLFRELHASRLQLDVTSAAEGREMTSGPDDNVTNDTIRDEDDVVCEQHAMFESQPELMDDQWLASFSNNMTPCMSESRDLFGSYYGSVLSNASPGGAFLPRFAISNGMFSIPYVITGIAQTELAECQGQTMASVVLPEALDMTRSISSHHQQQQQQQQSSMIDAQQLHLATIPSSLVGFAVVADAAGVVTVPSSSPSSSPSVMSASGAGGTGGCGESSEDATAAGSDDDPGSSSSSRASSSRFSPHSGIFSSRGEEGASPPTSGPPPTVGSLDRSTPPGADPSRLLQGSVALDHRRSSLELGSGGHDLVNGTGHLSQGAGVSAAAAATDVPAHLRRASIPCMSVSASRGLARAAAAAPHLGGQRPSAPLDYESLKVKLEKLTGTVTDGKRAKETAATDRSRRTSLVSLAHPPAASSGSSAMAPHPEVNRLTPTLTSSAATTVLVGEGAVAGSHPSFWNNGFTASYAVTEVDKESGSHLHPIVSFQPLEPIDAITQDAKTARNPTEDLSSSSSSSPSPSLSSSSSSSSSLDKFRLQYIIEHVLQYDVRLQEILKRHELEMAAIRLRHRFQWMELEKWLTQRFGDQWRKFITIPVLSLPLENVSTSPWRYPASVAIHTNEGVDKTGQPDELGCSICTQNLFDPLGTIKESQVDEDQLDSNATRICPQPPTTTAMHNTLQHCSRLVSDASKLSANVTDHAGRRCSDGCVDSPQRPRATSLSNILLLGEKAPNSDSAGSRICQNIASSLARRQSSVAIMNPNSSRLHRHTAPKEIASTRPDPSAPTRLNPPASIRPDAFASIRPDSAASTRPDASASSRPSTPQSDYRQLLLLAQALQNQTYSACLGQCLLPNVLPTLHAAPLQTNNFIASYGCDPTSLTALNGGILPAEMGIDKGLDLSGLRPAQQAIRVEAPPQWANGPQSASKNSLQAAGEEASRAFTCGQAQPLNGYPGLPHEVPGTGCLGGHALQGYPFPGLLPSNPGPCQVPSMTHYPWLMNVGGASGGDGPMPFVTPSSSLLGFPYTMVAPNPAFYSLLKDYGELM